MRTLATALAALAWLSGAWLVPAAASPDRPFYSADKLEALCTSRSAHARERCRGYIVGAADMMHGGHAICVPADATTPELVELVLAQIARSEEEAGRPAETEIHKALTDAFPAPPCM